MATKDLQVHATFSGTTAHLLSKLAYQKDKSLAELVQELTLQALEQQEDLYFSKLAEEIDSNQSESTLSDEDAWK